VALGAGRQSVSDSVDASAGFRLHVRLGDRVVAGQPLLTGYCSDAARLQAALERAGAAYVITEDGDENFTVPPLISHSLTANDRGPVSYKHNFEGMSAGWVRDAAAAK
jgi:thymidine phosphorylase